MKPRLAAGLAAIVFTGLPAGAQPPSSAIAFEAASIRPTGFGRSTPAAARIDASHLDLPFISLANLIPWAFRVKPYQVVMPTWVHQSLWSISAKLPDGASRDQAPEMMQALLKERFDLVIHREPRQQQGYELTVAADAPAMVPASPDDVPAWDGSSPGFDFGGPLRTTGIVNGRIVPQPNCSRQYQFVPLSMPALADTLTLFLGHPVLDHTGLNGTYKVTLEVPAEAEAGMTRNVILASGEDPPPGPGAGGGGSRGGGRTAPEPGPDGNAPAPPRNAVSQGCSDPMRILAEGSFVAPDAALTKALQKLGLKLQPAKATIETIVVDRLNKTPTGN